ncbi:MarR family transcriptional regulator [Changpingibacter yushuensis]|uniref:MarR family transcriptional regulator n=1 Tax=Changpingibacter yushuensis TaxID=2758440 RepID=UPI0015F5A2A9|nr:helix-turn-helix domain-containing protein [Changpingibacter yushuensis]
MVRSKGGRPKSVANIPESDWDRLIVADRALEDARQAAVEAGRARARVMRELADAGATQSEIARRLGVTYPAVQAALRSLL